MKVILLEDVKSLGKKGQLVDVSDGYARNFILAKKLGLEATSKNMNDLKLQKAHEDKLAAERLAEAKAFAEDQESRSNIIHQDRRGRKAVWFHLFQRDRTGSKRAAQPGY